MNVSNPSRYTSPVHASARFVAQRLLLKPFVWSITNTTVLGREKLKDLSGPFVVVSNHSSHLDAPLIIGSLPRRLSRYVAAGAAADYFFDVWWRRGLTALFFNAFPVDRTGLRGKRGMATGLLDAGVPLLLFPEGTRSRTGEMGQFKPGAAALCISRDVPCLPVAIVGAAEAMPLGRALPQRGRPPIFVTFGAPMTAEDGETALQFSDRIAKEVRELVDYTMTYRANHT
ncbi:MAG: Acyl-CoA:1-acyl-sn-glycerol-3-phosphate acyltransferase [uncultured Propionibacteriaceae bacterium]|uniref:Acyl-CoA:1-acyl-sn-glycerol-3-phosphate acyltransferase n=1 Tax=uncultured Propionibacteriaceae bacterium TaxID=257457 RepID=A0A6J4NFN0_9ACTN|nr:MAG: Acyl-CoA:1-acyl-sn-glycerol-3-phosphate acyltransferase [uncultured Propionibacteriaceae bacterium]